MISKKKLIAEVLQVKECGTCETKLQVLETSGKKINWNVYEMVAMVYCPECDAVSERIKKYTLKDTDEK